jgi:hypothetical protein
LILNECTTLQSISLPRSVIFLGANGCTSLERILVLTNESSGSSDHDNLNNWQKSAKIGLDNCHKLVEIQNLESLLCLPGYISMGNCTNLSSGFRESVLPYLLKVLSLSLSLSLSHFMTQTLF